MDERLVVRVTADPLDPGEAIDAVRDPGAGAVALFLGSVRDHSAEGDVTGLEYEAWEDLAVRRMREIGEEMLGKWPVRRAALLHRTGTLSVGEVSVAVACSAPHRSDAFEACRHGIERLKEDVPIWKKEALASGESHWVRGS